MKIPFFKTKKDLLTLGIIAILVIAVAAMSSAINSREDQYKKALDDAEIYYNNLLDDLKENVSTNMNILNQTIESLKLVMEVKNETIQFLEIQLNDSLVNNSNLNFLLNNYRNYLRLTTAKSSYFDAETNNSIGIFLFDSAKINFTSSKISIEAKNNCTTSKVYFTNAWNDYNLSFDLYDDALNSTTENNTIYLINLYKSLMIVEGNMSYQMLVASNSMINAINYYLVGDTANGIIQETNMNNALVTYASFKTTKNFYLNQIQEKLNEM